MFCVTKWASAHFFLCFVAERPCHSQALNNERIFGFREVMNDESKAAPDQIEAMVEALLKAEGLELVDLEFRKEARGWVLRIFMDKPGGVTLEDCSEINREIGDQIEVNELIPHSYRLEVSSPGLDRPLKKEKDFLGSIGKLIQLSTNVPLEGQTFFKGILLDFQASGGLRLAETKKTWEIPVGLISKARLVFEG